MSFTLWTSDADGIDLGNPLELLSAWSELSAIADEQRFGHLLAVPQTDEETISPEFYAQIAAESQLALREFPSLPDEVKWRLEALVSRGPLP